MAKDDNGQLIHSPGTGPRCTINRDKLEKAFDVVITRHRKRSTDYLIANAVETALIDVRDALLDALS